MRLCPAEYQVNGCDMMVWSDQVLLKHGPPGHTQTKTMETSWVFFLRFYCKNIEFDNTLQKHQHKHDTRRAQEHNLLVRDSSLNCAFNPPQKQFLSNFQTLRGSNEQHNYICFSGGGRRGGGRGGLLTTYLILNVTVGVKAAHLDSRCQ